MRRFSSVPSGHVVRAVAQPAMVATAMYTDGAANADRIFTIVPARVALRDPRRQDRYAAQPRKHEKASRTNAENRKTAVNLAYNDDRATYLRACSSGNLVLDSRGGLHRQGRRHRQRRQ